METKPFYPCPVRDQGEPVNNCAPDRIIWENEMLKSVWAAGLHDEANCFEDTLREKRILENRERMRKEVPKTNADRIRAMTDEELAEFLMTRSLTCGTCFFERRNRKDPTEVCLECVRGYLRWAPVDESEK